MREERMIVVDGISRTVVISDEREALLAADAAGRASVAVWNGDREEFLPSAFAVEDPADADGEFLERVVRRKLGLPWTIRETGRLLIREFAEEDSEQVPREECLGPGDEVFADREKLRAYIRCQYGISQYGIWAAVEKESGRLVGKIGFAPPEDGREGLEPGSAGVRQDPKGQPGLSAAGRKAGFFRKNGRKWLFLSVLAAKRGEDRKIIAGN